MSKKLQVILSNESWDALKKITDEANQDFHCGTINVSDVVNEMIDNTKIDIRSLQAKHINVRRTLRQMATQKNIDIDSVIQQLQEMKTSNPKRSSKQQASLKGTE